MSALCPDHSHEWQRWLDYRVPPRIRMEASAAADFTSQGIKDKNRARAGDWAATIRFQQALIVKECRNQCDVALPVGPLGQPGASFSDVPGQQRVDRGGPVGSCGLGDLVNGHPALVRDADGVVGGLGRVGHAVHGSGWIAETPAGRLAVDCTRGVGWIAPDRIGAAEMTTTDDTSDGTVECRPCKGRGSVPDTRIAAITHRATTVNRTCRYCLGSGRITPTQPVVEWDTEVGEIPAWMTGADDDEYSEEQPK